MKATAARELKLVVSEPVPVRLRPGSQAGDAVRVVLATGFSRLSRHAPSKRLSDDPEDVHQARVAARRLRSDLRTFRPLLDRERADLLRDELRWAADLLAEVRDADVLMGRLHHDAGMLPMRDAPAVTRLLRTLAAERDGAWVRARKAFRSDRYRDLEDRLMDFAESPPLIGEWAVPARDVAPGLVAPTWKDLRAKVRQLTDSSRPDELHEVRIRAKRCRYAVEAVAPFVGKRAARFASALADLQTVLGNHHDCYVADAWLREASTVVDSAQVLAAGELISLQMIEAARLEREWPKAWAAVSKKDLRRWLG